MVNSRTALLDETFFALSDPTRREMVARLASRDMTVSELAQPFDISPPAVSKHLRVLERAGLLTSDRVGRVRRCRTNGSQLQVTLREGHTDVGVGRRALNGDGPVAARAV